MKNFLFLTVIISFEVICPPNKATGSSKHEHDDAPFTSEEINKIENPRMHKYIRNLKSNLTMTRRRSFFSRFGCAFQIIRADLEYTYRSDIKEQKSYGINIGGIKLNEYDKSEGYPTDIIHGAHLSDLHFPHERKTSSTARLLQSFHHWFAFIRNDSTPFTQSIREGLMELSNQTYGKLDDEVARGFAYGMARTYVLSCYVINDLLRRIARGYTAERVKIENDITANGTTEMKEHTFEEWVSKAVSGNQWFFPKIHFQYLNVLRRALGKKHGKELLGLEYGNHIIPYTDEDACPALSEASLCKIDGCHN